MAVDGMMTEDMMPEMHKKRAVIKRRHEQLRKTAKKPKRNHPWSKGYGNR